MVVSQLMLFAGANFQQGGAWHVQDDAGTAAGLLAI